MSFTGRSAMKLIASITGVAKLITICAMKTLSSISVANVST